MKNPSYKMIRIVFFGSMLLFLVASAATGIFSVITNSFNETHARVLFTTVALGVYSLTGLCCSSNLNRPNLILKVFAALGVGISILAATFVVLTNWGLIIDRGIILQGRVMFLIVAITLAHISLLMVIKTNNLAVNIVRGCTIGTILMVALILIGITAEPKLIGSYTQFQRSLWMFLAISGILDVLGTLSIPILQLIVKDSSRDLSDKLSEQYP